MDYKTAAKLSSYLAKDYGEDFFTLLVNYQDISASEAASRLGLHIRTAQDFLDGLTDLGIVNKIEVREKKRPYFRYNLNTSKIKLEVDLEGFKKEDPGEGLERLIREKNNNGANYSIARSGDCFSSVTVWEGEGRERKVHNINLTTSQGKFLFHLPFPKARPLTIAEVIDKAELDLDFSAEIQDIIDELIRLEVIDVL